jgi:hypothetical protein
MAHPFLHDSVRWLRSAERARASADKLLGFPDLQEVMRKVAGIYEDLASEADLKDPNFPWRP